MITSNTDEEIVEATFDVTTATLDQKKQFVSQCLGAYKETIVEPQVANWLTFKSYLFPLLSIPKYKYKTRDWKPLFIEANTAEVSD